MTGCDAPLTYDVVSIDPQHRITRAAFVALLRRSETVWEAPSGLDVLRYAPGGTVKVQLVHDDRQVMFDRIAAADADIAKQKAAVAVRRKAMARQRAVVNARKAKLDKRIATWNAKGGAPPEVFAELKAETKAVNTLIEAGNAEVRSFNAAVATLNAAVEARNALSRSHGTDESTLGRAEVGGTSMEIYVIGAGAVLDASLLAHEFGHILGIEHVAGSGNIMNPVRVKPLTAASTADVQALRAACAKPRPGG